MTERVRLESVTSGEDARRRPSWIVSFGFYFTPPDPSPILTATFAIPKAEYDEEHVVKIGRYKFSTLCKHLAKETASWDLGADGAASLKRSEIVPSS